MMPAPTFTRRAILASGGLTVMLASPTLARAASTAAPAATAAPGGRPGTAGADPFGPFVHIAPSGQITFVAPNAEIGQGIWTAEAQILAEELGCKVEDVHVEAAPPDEAQFGNPLLKMQVTGGSTSVQAFYTPLRQAGASARLRLQTVAAKRWGVDPGTCEAHAGRIVHPGTSRSLGFGELAAAAALEPAPDPKSLVLKPHAAFTVIGRSAPRLDVPGKANGSVIYGIDMVRPGMLIAVVTSCPLIGGRLGSVDPAPALAVRGVRQVLPFADAVAVVGDTTWAALKGMERLVPDWTGGDTSWNDARISRDLDRAKGQPPLNTKNAGDPGPAIAQAPHRLDLVYEEPFLVHAPMEPMNATIELGPTGCDVWLGTQSPVRVQKAAAKAAGLPLAQVRVHNLFSGGGFGRRSYADYIPIAVAICKRVGRPVKMLWSREQDTRGGKFRPTFRHDLSIGITAAGDPSGWKHNIVGGSVVATWDPKTFARNDSDSDAIEGAIPVLYKVGPMHMQYVRHDPPIPIGFWRSVGPGHNMFVVEGTINELAARAGVDPVAYRHRLLKDDPRASAVLNLAATKAHWGTPLPPGCGRGIAIQFAFGSYLACVVEAAVGKEGDIKLRRAVAAVDCGQVINPNGAAGQIEGALIFGLSAALWGKINIAGGRIVQSNFNDYRVLRIDETPPIEVHIVESTQPPGGLGETGTSISFPALAAAVYAATGVRLRTLPLDRHPELVGKTKGRGEGGGAALWMAAALRSTAPAIESAAPVPAGESP